MAYPEPANVAPWYLRNITQALALNEATGNVYVRTDAQLTIGNVGNVNVTDVEILALGNIDISGNTMPVSGNVTVFQGTIPWVVTGNTNVAITSGNVGLTGNLAGITGNVTVNPITGTVSITGNANVAGNVGIIGNIAGITANVTVVDGGGSLTVDGNVGIVGNVNVTQGTTPWSVTGNVTANLAANSTVNVASLPAAAITAFQEPFAITIIPDIQIDAVYGYETDAMSNVQTLGGTASANATTSLFSVSSGTTANAIGSITSRRVLKYRPGQGAMARITAAFTADGSGDGVANTEQIAGFIQDNQAAYGFGFSGNTATGNTGVGILHMYNGLVECRTLTVTTAAGGAQTATITLDGTAYTASLTNAAGDANLTAAQITAGNTWGGQWVAGQIGNTVNFTATQAAARAGTYSFSSTGTGNTAAGTFARTAAGQLATQEWTYQADWNGTPVTFDPAKLNVYGIDFRWLGAGIVRFFMEDPANGDMILVHTQIWSSQHLIPHQNNPSFRVGLMAENSGGSSTGATVMSASMMAAIQGEYQQTTYSRSWQALNSTTRAQNTLHHLISIRNPYQRSGKLNMQELLFESLSVALQGTDPSVIYVFINATPSTTLVFNAVPDTFATYSTTPATFSTATNGPVAVFTVGINGSSQFDLIPFRLVLEPGDVINVGFSSTNNITNSAAALTWAPE